MVVKKNLDSYHKFVDEAKKQLQDVAFDLAEKLKAHGVNGQVDLKIDVHIKGRDYAGSKATLNAGQKLDF